MKRSMIAVMSCLSLVGANSGLYAYEEMVDVTVCQSEKMSEAWEKGEPIAVPAGTVLSLSFFVRGSVLSFVPHEDSLGMVTVLEGFYVKRGEESILVSKDLATWVSWEDFFTGNLSLQVGCDAKGGVPTLQAGMELYPRP